MKTEDFIRSLAADSSPPWRFRSLMTIGVAASVASAATLFFALVGFRADIAQAMESWRFFFKFVMMIALAAIAIRAVLGVGRPGDDARPYILALTIVPLLIIVGAVAELLALPRELWAPSLIGSNAGFCLTLIPLLASGPLIALFAILRAGAPANPGLAGAVVGIAASGIGAAFYATHCPDDSPLFVMVWYSVAILIVVSIGYLIGRKIL